MRKGFLSIVFIFLFVTCTTIVSDRSELVYRAMVKEVTKKTDTSVVLYMDLLDSSLVKNVRMLEYKAKVRSIENSLLQLSEISNRFGGYVSSDKTRSEKLNVQLSKIRSDTSLLVTQYLAKSTIMLRIPHFNFDNALAEINKIFTYVDYRYSKVNDSLISRYTAHNYLTKEKSKGEGFFFNGHYDSTEYDRMIDQYANSYGAIIVTIYQNPEFKIEKLKSINLVPEFKVPFLSQTGLELNRGLEFLKSFWYLIVRFWPILAIVFITAIVIALNNGPSDKKFHIKNWIDFPKI
jgi:hypothetical protein